MDIHIEEIVGLIFCALRFAGEKILSADSQR